MSDKNLITKHPVVSGIIAFLLVGGIIALVVWLMTKPKADATMKRGKEKFMFENDPRFSTPPSQIRIDNLSPAPCGGGFKGRPIYFDYTSANDVGKYCGEVIPPEEMGRDAGFRGRRLLSTVNARDSNIV